MQVFRFLFLALLTVGVVAAPCRFAAQVAPAQPQASAPAPAGAEAARPGEAAKPEADENDKFRHAALVQGAARMLHLPVETMARTFEFINFAIIVLAIGIPLVRFMPRIIRKRSETLRGSIESARKVTEDANTRLSAVEAKLSHLDEEIAKFRTEVEAEIGQDELRIKAALEEESARIVAAAEQEITVAAAQARRGLRNFATDLAIDQAAKQLVLTPENDRALIAEFVGDVGRNGTAKGGQN